MRLIKNPRTEIVRSAANILLPLFAAGTLYANLVCETGCTYIHGGLFGLDLHCLGFILAGAILLLSLPLGSRAYRSFGGHARAVLLCMAVGGGVVLLHFQIANQVFCPFCLAYGGLFFVLFLLNISQTSRTVCAVSFGAGLLIFALFFEGSVMPIFEF